MNDPNRKPVVHLLPAILTGAATLIASLTAVYVNLRNDRPVPAATAAPAATSTSAAPSGNPGTPAAAALPAPAVPAAQPPPPPPPPPDRYRLQLDRIAVQHDGSMLGTENWRFTVEADGQPLLAFTVDSLDDTGGRNVATPKDVNSPVRVTAAEGTRLLVKAWRSRLRLKEGEPDAIGTGVLGRDGSITPLRVASMDDPKKGELTFFFSARPEPE